MNRLMTMSLMPFIAWTVPTTSVRAERYAPHVGERHSEIVLPTIHDGKPVSLSQFHGKKVLFIQFASW